MKAIKKTKIVNIGINTPVNKPANTIHFSNSQSQDHLSNPKPKREQIIDDCYEVLKIIASQKAKGNQMDKKVMSKNTTQCLQQLNKKNKQNNITLSVSVAESVQFVLKKFVQAQAGEHHKGFRTSSSKFKQYDPKSGKSNTVLYFRHHKQNIQESSSAKLQNDDCSDIFKNTSSNTPNNAKLQSKINQLQTKVGLYKEKIAELTVIIGKLETREALIRKKYQDEVNKIIRNKNIVSIQSSYEKVVEGKEERRGLMGVNGRGIGTPGLKKKSQQFSRRSSQSSGEITIKDSLFAQKKTLKKQKQGFIPYESSNNIFSSYLMNKLQTLKQNDHKEVAYTSPEKCSQNSQRLQELKSEEVLLLQQREETIGQMSCKANEELSRNLKQLQEKLMQKMSQIQQQEILQEKLQHVDLALKDEQFQALQMNGFYQEPDLKFNVYPQL